MDKAKAAVSKFTSKSGHHDTTIHEQIAPAVQHEQVTRKEHEEATTAIDREVHQDHYHTSEQPIQHSEVLPEQHHHNVIPVEHKSYEHDSPEEVQRKLDDERTRYRDEQTRIEGEKSHSVGGVVAGEHVHHHVHENIQPVIQKQTIEPHVVHTTVPIHEVHHNKAQHHSASSLPPVSMDDFKKQGGSLGGREERHDHFDGEPRSFGGHLRDGENVGHSSHDIAGANTGSQQYGSNPSGYDNSSSGYNNSTSGSAAKPSLMDKLNPKVDANGDGKPGFMK